jgi:hypothetical protein
VEACDGFVNGAHIGPMRLLEGGQRPALRLEPLGMPFGPRAFAALLELSQAKSNPRLLQSRGRSFHMV